MKVQSVSTTFALALLTSVQAAPAQFGPTTAETALSKRQEDQLKELTAAIDHFQVKRAEIVDPVELQAREYALVTQILAAINSTNLAPKIIQGLVTNKLLQPLVTNAVIAIIRSGIISLDTLFQALDKSGLATRVVKDLLNDCTFYEDIFKLALKEISNLVDKIQDKLSGGSPDVKRFLEEDEYALPPQVKRSDEEIEELMKRYDEDGIVNNLLESLANSGLASSVVRVLLVDPQFLEYGVDLIKKLWDEDLIDLTAFIKAIANSGLVTSLFKEFFNLETLKTVIFNALAALFGTCDGSTISGSPTGLTTQTTSTTSLPTFTATGTSVPTGCKKRRRRRSYNY
ncbi:hypothetical protein CXQ85_003280 [Candidozyma haemuli]|uniref:Opaque-phase-specific protein OP4 n=1 Tax=Candidozyma haemuli TaxID=45357 RepID=A0A2V1AP01_9ASCO|nr:hypothetical protein CXQ85_003280 [[Candida] haemuloni]PVH19434.1 hypothetical protein CXQ85_003280 [[Candida] haemuloni]